MNKMFLQKYLSSIYYDLVINNYDYDYLMMLDETNFGKIYNVLKKYNFYFINDIILNYIEIFFMTVEEVEKGMIKLREKLGDKFVYIIGNDMRYLDEIIDGKEEF